MANRTDNFALVLPDEDEFYDIGVFNENFNRLDGETAKRLEKNPDIEKGIGTKITYDEKGLVLKGENLTPDDIPNIHISQVEGRPPIVYINGIPIYGSRFFDVDESGNAVLKEDGSGKYLLTVLETGEVLLRKVITSVIDDTETDNPQEALSARQGRVLSGWIGRVSELLTSAKMSLVDAVNELLGMISLCKDEIATKIPAAEKGAAGGVAMLDGNGCVPAAELPYFNTAPTLYVNGMPLYGTTLVDVDTEGTAFLREDGRGDYLLAVTYTGNPYLKYIGSGEQVGATGEEIKTEEVL